MALPRASMPYGIVVSPADGSAWVALEATGQLLRLNSAGAITATRGGRPEPAPGLDHRRRHARAGVALHHAGAAGRSHGRRADRRAAVARWWSVDAGTLAVQRHDRAARTATRPTTPCRAAACRTTWAPLRSRPTAPRPGCRASRTTSSAACCATARTSTSRTRCARSARASTWARWPRTTRRASTTTTPSVASAAAFHPSGAYLFVALETSRQVAVVDAYGRREMFRFDAGRAPQGVAVSADGAEAVRQQLHGPQRHACTT